MPDLVRGAVALAGAVAVLALSGCGGGATTTRGEPVTTEASTAASTIGVPTDVFVMNSGRERLVEPEDFIFNLEGAVVGAHLHWTGWGEPAATAVGAFSEPRFSGSKRVRFRSNLRLTQLRVCNGAEYYTHASLPVPSSPTQPADTPLPTPCG